MRLLRRLGQSAPIMFLVADAALLLVLERRWVRFTLFGKPGGAYFQLMNWFLRWPEEGLHLLGAAEALLAARPSTAGSVSAATFALPFRGKCI